MNLGCNRWRRIHDVETEREWRSKTKALAKKAGKGDITALVDLIRMDPRYLGSELVAYQILSLKLDVLLGNRRFAPRVGEHDESALEQQLEITSDEASAHLEALGAAVAFTTGPGPQDFISPWDVADQLKDIQRKVNDARSRMAGRSSVDAAEVTKAVGLRPSDADAIAQLVVKPNDVSNVVREIVAARFNLKRKSIDQHIAFAKAIVDEPF